MFSGEGQSESEREGVETLKEASIDRNVSSSLDFACCSGTLIALHPLNATIQTIQSSFRRYPVDAPKPFYLTRSRII